MVTFPVGFHAVSSPSPWPPHPGLTQVTGGRAAGLPGAPTLKCYAKHVPGLAAVTLTESPGMGIFSSKFTKEKTEVQVGHAALGLGQEGANPGGVTLSLQPTTVLTRPRGSLRLPRALPAPGDAVCLPRGTRPDPQAVAGGKGFEVAQGLQPQGPNFKSQQLMHLACDPEHHREPL